MIDQNFLDLLHELSADVSGHSGRTLLDHLTGTSDLLEAWGNPPDTCVAGLFHSIYGTQYYHVQSADPADRARIADAIGPRAEELAYLFSMGDRTKFLEEAGRPAPAVVIRDTGEGVRISAEQLAALLEIEAANCIEQLRPEMMTGRRRAMLASMLQRGGNHLSAGACTALQNRVEQDA